VTDANGRAEFLFQLEPKVGPETHRYLPTVYTVSVYGSLEALTEIFSVPGKIWGGLVAVGRAFVLGDDSLGSDANWLERGAAWVSGILPGIGSVRDFVYEIYKAATGCDETSWWQVGFATVGVLADVATFGTASLALRGARTTLYPVMKLFIRETIESGAGDLAFRAAFGAYVELTTREIVDADHREEEPAAWVDQSEAFLEKARGWADPGTDPEAPTAVADKTYHMFRGPQDALTGLDVYTGLLGPGGEDEGRFEDIFADDQLFEELLGDPPPGQASAGFRGPVFICGASVDGFECLEQWLATVGVGPSWVTDAAALKRNAAVMPMVAKAVKNQQLVDAAANPQAWKGLEQLTMLVCKGSYTAETTRRLTQRLMRSLEAIEPSSARENFLEHFAEMTEFAGNSKDLMKRVQTVATLVAARSQNLASRRRAMNGALGQVAAFKHAKDLGFLEAIGDNAKKAIEPMMGDPKRAWFDLWETGNGRNHLVEVKNWSNLQSPSSIQRVREQVGKNFGRLLDSTDSGIDLDELADLADFPRTVVRYPTGVAADASKLTEAVTEAIIGSIAHKTGWDKTDVRAWLKQNDVILVEVEAIEIPYGAL